MDTSDPDIAFDAQGICNHCHTYDTAIRRYVITGEAGKRYTLALVDKIKRTGAKKPYDCLIGLSGGVDSTYVAYKVKQYGLRPLALHLDNGWDSELAVKNIENVCNKLNIDLHTTVLDWEEFRELQIAFLRAATPDAEIPSDHAITASAVHSARQIGVSFIITGNNLRTETHVPRAWSQGHLDWRYIRSVNKAHGSGPLRSFPHLGMLDFHLHPWNKKFVNILNYIDYSKKNAITLLEKELGWKYYGGKHYESIYTRWYQGFYLPQKFGYDKRRSHLSSLICSGEITRQEALQTMQDTEYSVTLQKQDTAYVIKKLGLSEDEFQAIMHLPKKKYSDYRSYGQIYRTRLFGLLRKFYRAVHL